MINAFGDAAAANVKTYVHTVGEHDLCRVHVNPSNHPVDAEVTAMKSGQHQKKTAFYIRQNNATKEITDEAQKQKYIAQRWS